MHCRISIKPHLSSKVQMIFFEFFIFTVLRCSRCLCVHVGVNVGAGGVRADGRAGLNLNLRKEAS